MAVNLKNGNSTNYDEVVAALTEEGCRNIFEWSDPPGSEYGWHSHPHDEVRWVLKGSIFIGTDDGDLLLNPGDRLNIPANTRHWAKSDNGVTYICATTRHLAGGGN